MKKVNVYEDNGGFIHVMVCGNGKIINIISGFEDPLISKDEFIEAAQAGFQYADDYDSDNYSGCTMEQVAEELESMDDLIAEITDDFVVLHPNEMGCAGLKLFELEAV